MRGTDFAEALPYVEKGRTAAAGASYGGYMVNWIAGHTDRYRALVSHDGVFDLALDVRRDRGAVVPGMGVPGAALGQPARSTSAGARATSSRTSRRPTLVVHSELDYRVPLEQGLGMFTALQRQGVPSRLLVFPDEGHWVLQPANSRALVPGGPRLARPLDEARGAVKAFDYAERWGHEEVVLRRDAALRPARDHRAPRHHPRPRHRRHAHAHLRVRRRRRSSTPCAWPGP